MLFRSQGVEHVLEAARSIGAVGEDNAVTKSTLRDAIHRGRQLDRPRWISAAIVSGELCERPGARAGTLVWVEE